METKISHSFQENLKRMFGHMWELSCIPSVAGGITILWRIDRVHIETFWDGRQALFGVITDFRMVWGRFTSRGLQRRVLWRQLSLAQEYGIPICWIGDFNIIRKEEEKKGGAAVKFHRDVREFSNYINNNALIDS